MNKTNHLGRVLSLLLLTWLLCLGMYGLPDSLFGLKLRRVDLLSDFCIAHETTSLDSLRKQLTESFIDSVYVDSVALQDSLQCVEKMDSARIALRDSLYKVLYAVNGADSLGLRIEDYSLGHIGLKRFFTALRNKEQLGRPVRIAFLGDSFIEGDIMVADIRSKLQQKFGGRGVGFVPIYSVAAQYRPTVHSQSSGWITKSILTDRKHAYTLSGMFFDSETSIATLQIKSSERYQELKSASSLKFIYEQNDSTQLNLMLNVTDTLRELLPPTKQIIQQEWKGEISEADFLFEGALGLRALGVALEDNEGVIVDNFSLRGNSGMVLAQLDSSRCREWNQIRPYDLIVLQYGLNVASDSVLNYGWYGAHMVKVINHLQCCFPESDLLLLSVSDRSRQTERGIETMPAVLALLYAQRQIARRTGIPFWNMFGAMGGENSMVNYVKNNWASKDYTHLSFRGGGKIAEAFLKALLVEKEYYDEMEKIYK